MTSAPDHRDQSARLLEQAHRDSQTFLSSSLRSETAEPEDEIERLGRRIGRGLAVLATIVGVIWLLRQLQLI